MLTYCDKDFKLAGQYVEVVLAMDKMYREKTSDSESSFSSEGLIPVIMGDFNTAPIESWQQARQQLKEIYNGYLTIENDVRRNYMAEQISSVILLGDWVLDGKEESYRYMVQNLLQVDPNPITKAQQTKLHKKLDALLSYKNYGGNCLRTKIEKWKHDRHVDKKDLQDVLNDYIVKCKADTIDFGMKEMADVNIRANVVYDVAYGGYIDFLGGVMFINGDLFYTYEELKHLVTHETFPGHTAHMEIRRNRVKEGSIPADAALVFTNTASSPIFEGIGDNAANFINWYSTIDDEIAVVLQAIKSTASYIGAHMLHEENKNPEEVKRMFAEYAFMDEAAISSKMRFISHPLRKTFIYGYWRGNETVYDVYSKVNKEEFPKFIDYLYGNMHSANTVKQFLSVI